MPILSSPAPPAVERAVLWGSVGLLAALAWLAFWIPDGLAHGALHHGLGVHSASSPGMMALFVGSWTVMTVAMMLPTTLPVLSTFHSVARERADRAWLVTLVVVGYLLSWAVFGALLYLAHLLLRWLASWSVRWDALASAGAPLLLLAAGAFQFTKLKYECLEKCRSPLTFVIEHWQGRAHRGQAFRLGIDHGLFCIGCCWALMLLMFVVGAGHLGWMLALALVMAVEKNMPWGRRLSAPLGVALLVWGSVLLLRGNA